jgi:hypothetical protein
MLNPFVKERFAKIPVPVIEEWSAALATENALGVRLSAEEKAAEDDIRRSRELATTETSRQSRAEIIASGKTPPDADTSSIDEKVSHLRDIQLARKLQADRYRKLRTSEDRRLCLELKPMYDASAAVFVQALLKAHAALLEMDELEIALRRQDIGFYPIVCNIRTDRVFGSATDRTGDFAMLLRECVEHGHLKQLPNGLN